MSVFSRPKGVDGVMTEANKDALRREVECPQCSAHFLFRRMRVPHFDAHGFEIYKLACKSCGVSLAGIVDPSDRTPLLSVDSFSCRA